MNLTEGLLMQAKQRLGYDGVVSEYRQREYTLGEYMNMVDAVAKTSRAFAPVQDTIALLLFDDCPAAIGVFLGCIQAGMVPLLVSKKANEAVLDSIITMADPAVVWSDQSDWPGCVLSKRSFVLVSEKESDLSFITQKNERETYGMISSTEVAYLGMTSGSSGMPKLVMHSHKEMLFANDNYALASLQLKTGDRLYSVPKMNFTYGMANSLFFSFAAGATALLDEEGFTWRRCLQHLQEFKPTCFFAVPSVYQALCRVIKEENIPQNAWKTLRLCVSAGEALHTDLVREWKELTGHEIVDSVGCSETGSAFLVNFGGEAKRGSAGTAVPGYHVHLLQTNPEEKGNEGILCIKSESNALGYYRNPEETKAKFLDGWLKTGDVFRVDEDGYYWFIGREDSLLKYNGMWVCPEQVEAVLLQYPGVKECAVFKAERDRIGRMAAVICVNEEFDHVYGLKQYAKSRLEGYKCPRIIRIVDALPLNLNGKRDYAQMKKIAQRWICTIDGESRLGKGILAHRMADSCGLQAVSAGKYYRLLAWGYQHGLLSEADMDQEAVLLEYLANTTSMEESKLYKEEHALLTAQLAQHKAVQFAVLRHMRLITMESSIVAEGRNMGSEVFDDADMKIFLTGSVEGRVRKWCSENGYGEEMVSAGIANVTRRDLMDRERAVMPLRKAVDALEICVDGKDAETVFAEVMDLWKEI